MGDTGDTAEKELSGGWLSTGVVALGVSVLFCAAAHLILRQAASDLSGGSTLALFFNWRIVLGLAVYAVGTGLWLFCLSQLELSVAFPASALQFLLVLGGAKWFLGEQISAPRMAGVAIILVGIALLFFERRKKRA